MVGTKTLINFLFVLLAISPLFSLVAKPTAQTPFLGYSIKLHFFYYYPYLKKFQSFVLLQKIALKREFLKRSSINLRILFSKERDNPPTIVIKITEIRISIPGIA